VLPHGLYEAFVFADFDLQFLRRTQLLEAGKARESVAVVAGVLLRSSTAARVEA
jgi:hypothetical protein